MQIIITVKLPLWAVSVTQSRCTAQEVKSDRTLPEVGRVIFHKVKINQYSTWDPFTTYFSDIWGQFPVIPSLNLEYSTSTKNPKCGVGSLGLAQGSPVPPQSPWKVVAPAMLRMAWCVMASASLLMIGWAGFGDGMMVLYSISWNFVATCCKQSWLKWI